MDNRNLTSDSIPQPIGKSVARIDGLDKVTGAAQFADDIQFGPGLLYARIKRSPYPHAWSRKIDVSKAKAFPGVRAVVTGEDFPGLTGLYLQDRSLFCCDRARYVGDLVAGVAAIHDATGVWMDEIPVTPERMWNSIHFQEK